MFRSFFDAAAAPTGTGETSAAPTESQGRLAEAEAEGLTCVALCTLFYFALSPRATPRRCGVTLPAAGAGLC